MVEESASDVSTAATGDYVDYSRTNIQEAGVDEGDIIKTDGTWIYILKQDGSFSIVRDYQTERSGKCIWTAID